MSETKICSKCKQELPLDEFRWKNKSKGIKHSQCKTCQKKQEKIHYQECIERREQVLSDTKLRKIGNVNLVEARKIDGCLKCGEKRSYVLDFHHRDSKTKENTINHLIKSGSADKLILELKKCDVLCANCHREFHYLNLLQNLSYEDWLQS